MSGMDLQTALSFSDANLTSITVQWTELPCSDRNGEITGYTVGYSSTRPPHTNTVTVSGSSTTRLVGLLPRTNYTFSVRAVGALGLMGPSASESSLTSTPSGLKGTDHVCVHISLCTVQALVSSSMVEFSLTTV